MEFKKVEKWIYPILVFVITIIVAVPFATIGADPDGHGVLIPAFDILHGKMIFRDTYTMYGALSSYIQAGVMKIFGERIEVAQWLTVFFYGMIATMLWFLWRKVMNKWLSLVAFVIWISMSYYFVTFFLFQPWPSVYALFFQLLTAYLVMIYVENNNRKVLMLAGIMAAITFLCRQPVGEFLAIALGVYLILNDVLTSIVSKKIYINIKDYLVLFVGFAGIIIIFFGWLFINDAFEDFWKQSFLVSISWMKFQAPGTTLIGKLLADNFGILSTWAIIPIVILVSFFWLVIMLFSKKIVYRDEHKKIIVLMLVSIASWIQYFPNVDVNHCWWAATPMYGLFVFIIWKVLSGGVFSKNTRTNAIIFGCFLVLFFQSDLRTRVESASQKLNQTYSKIENPEILRGLKLNPDEVKYYSTISGLMDYYTQKYPDSKIVSYGYDGLYLMFNKNIERFHKLWSGYDFVLDKVYPDFNEKFSNYVIKNQPMILVSEPNDIVNIISDKNLLENYCVLFNGKYWYNRTLYMLAPCDKVKVMVGELQKK